MRIVSSLLSGIPGAANGTAEIRDRAGLQRVQWYTDFEGQSTGGIGTDVDLDSNGSAVVYVGQLVQITVKDSSGSTVRTYVDGNGSANTEIISQSFTGQDYETAESAASKPTTLQEVMDLWFTQNGCIDWKIDLDGTCKTIKQAVSGIGGECFNVKNTDYGATGDGTTDDADAIDAAIAAADDNGGTVCFPAGTYRVTRAIAVPANVNLQGVGTHSCEIRVDAAAEHTLTFAGDTGVDEWQFVDGLKFTSAQANSKEVVLFTDSKLIIRNCEIDGTNIAARLIVSDTDANTTEFKLALVDNIFRASEATVPMMGVDAGTMTASKNQHTLIKGNAFYPPVGAGFVDELVVFRKGMVVDNLFDASSAAGNPDACVNLQDGGVFVGNVVMAGTGGELESFTAPVSSSVVYEGANQLVDNGANLALPGGDVNSDTIISASLRNRWLETSYGQSPADHVTEPERYGVEHIVRTSVTSPGAHNVQLSQGIEGQEYTLIYTNEDGADDVTITWTGGGVTENATENVSAGNTRVFNFVTMTVNSSLQRLVQIGSSSGMSH